MHISLHGYDGSGAFTAQTPGLLDSLVKDVGASLRKETAPDGLASAYPLDTAGHTTTIAPLLRVARRLDDDGQGGRILWGTSSVLRDAGGACRGVGLVGRRFGVRRLNPMAWEPSAPRRECAA